MRDLTEEELALAPEWATHYSFTSFDVLCFVDIKNKIVTSIEAIKRGECPISCGNWFEGVDLPEIHRKPFDITQHNLNDHLTELESGNLSVNDCGWIIDKERAIAIAKHFKLTAEDLK